MEDSIKLAANVVPSSRQINWQKIEFYGFIHFGMNTFTNREWGTGNESPELFNPSKLNPRQWVKALKDGGMKGVIITAKHHDGFCLWPSKYTKHSVKYSPWKHGKGDVIKELSEACKDENMKLGIYLSPWDRHDLRYGTDEYNTFFLNQLEELLTGYGPLFAIWFDGACGEGKDGKQQKYDWSKYYKLIRKHQPQAVISASGPDVRWCGNEAGYCRPQEWSVLPASAFNLDEIAEKSQHEDDGQFNQSFNPIDTDLGSRTKIRNEKQFIWYPAEVDTSIRYNWFYHRRDDIRVRSLNELFNVYCKSVGGNCTFLLNVPPTKSGEIHPLDVKRLKTLGHAIKTLYKDNLLTSALIKTNIKKASTKHLVDGLWHTYLEGNNPIDKTTKITASFNKKQLFNTLILEEFIEKGQHIENFHISILKKGTWLKIYEGHTIGYRKICRFKPVTSHQIKITIVESRGCPFLRSLQLCNFKTVGLPNILTKSKVFISRLLMSKFIVKLDAWYVTHFR